MGKWLFSVLLCISFHGYCYDLFIVRHFEKLAGDPNPGLSKLGQQRAEILADYLSSKNIEYLYSTNYHRTKQSAAPFAQRAGLDVQLYDPKQLKKLADTLTYKQRNALVLGHSNTTPELISLLGGVATKIDEHEYGELFILHVSDSGVETNSIIISSK